MGKIIAMLKKRSVKDYQTTIKMLRRGDIIIDQEGKMYVVLKEDTVFVVPYEHLLKEIIKSNGLKKEENERS